MNSVPVMISTKDLDYISDMLNWNLTIIKKINHFTNIITQEDIKQEFINISNMHQKHYNMLLNLLK